MNEERFSQFLHEIEAERIPASVDFWPAIQAQVSERKPSAIRNKPIQMVLLALLLGLVLAAALFVASPDARAAVQRIQRFAVLLVAPELVDRPESSTEKNTPGPGPTAVASEQRVFLTLSQEEIQAQIPFHLPKPGWLPNGVSYQGGAVGEMQSANNCVGEVCNAEGLIYDIVRRYLWEDRGENLLLQMWSGKPAGGYVFPEEAMQPVKVNGREAVYILQTWEAAPEVGQMTPGGSQAISWEDDRGFTYLLMTGLELTKLDIIRIAESVE